MRSWLIVAGTTLALAGCGGDEQSGERTTTVDSNAAQKAFITRVNATCDAFKEQFGAAKGRSAKKEAVMVYLQEIVDLDPAGAIQTETFRAMQKHAGLLREAMAREDDKATLREQRRYQTHLADLRAAGSTC